MKPRPTVTNMVLRTRNPFHLPSGDAVAADVIGKVSPDEASGAFHGDHPHEIVQDFCSEQFLEQMFDGFSSALEYFGATFHGADSDVLAGACRAFA